MLYMPEVEINLISQGQIYCKSFYFLTILDDGICIGNLELFACFIYNNLYIIDTARFSTFAFVFINKKSLRD